jgi:hypothetical protein
MEERVDLSTCVREMTCDIGSSFNKNFRRSFFLYQLSSRPASSTSITSIFCTALNIDTSHSATMSGSVERMEGVPGAEKSTGEAMIAT